MVANLGVTNNGRAVTRIEITSIYKRVPLFNKALITYNGLIKSIIYNVTANRTFRNRRQNVDNVNNADAC